MRKKDERDNALICTNCNKDFYIDSFDEETLDIIIEYCCLLRTKQEHNFLYKIEKMYYKYPQSIAKMVPQNSISDELKPSDDEVELWTGGDKSLKDFLFSSSFDLQKRIAYLEEVKEDINPIFCSNCSNGVIIFKDDRLRDYEPKLTLNSHNL